MNWTETQLKDIRFAQRGINSLQDLEAEYGLPVAAAMWAELDLCHIGQVEYVATLGAPGVGQSWKCKECGKDWVKVGANFIDPNKVADDSEPPWVMDPIRSTSEQEALLD